MSAQAGADRSQRNDQLLLPRTLSTDVSVWLQKDYVRCLFAFCILVPGQFQASI